MIKQTGYVMMKNHGDPNIKINLGMHWREKKYKPLKKVIQKASLYFVVLV